MNFETTPFFSLRYRLLLPLWAASIAAAIVVATLSFFLGRQWAIHDVFELAHTSILYLLWYARTHDTVSIRFAEFSCFSTKPKSRRLAAERGCCQWPPAYQPLHC
ncbi:MAG: hypothetical protein IT422_23565 [Pirellulaceae bacterium]|nr:hypothetical protein [Pirellulaceae bacterium]